MCAASWRDRLYSERWALECLHQVYRATVEFLAHAPRDAQEVLPPVLDDLIIALRSASSQPDLEFVGLVTVHRVQAQRRTLRALVTPQDSLSFLGYRDQRFPLSYPHLAFIPSSFYRLPDLLEYRVRPPIGPFHCCLPPSTAGFLYLPEPVGFVPAGFFLKSAQVEIAQYVLRLLWGDAYCVPASPPLSPQRMGSVSSPTRSPLLHTPGKAS